MKGKHEKFDSVILQKIYDSVHKENRNYLVLFCGHVGTGKSISACRLAFRLDPGFSLKRVVFDEVSFMDLVNSGLPPGSCIVADEIGKWFGSREHMTRGSRTLNHVLQTFRQKRLILFVTVPHRFQVDKTFRSMADMTIVTKKIDWDNDRSMTSVLYWSVDPLTGFERPRYPRKPVPGKDSITIMRFWIKHPGHAFERRYIKKKTEKLSREYATETQTLKDLKARMTGPKRKPRGKRTKCVHCKHEWVCSSKRIKPQCPVCMKLTDRGKSV